MYRQSEKKLLNIDKLTFSTCLHNMVNFGLLTAEICWRVWGTPANFNGFRVLAALLLGTLVMTTFIRQKMSDNTKRRQTVLDFSGGWEVRPQETHVGLADPYGRPKKQLGVTREPLTPHGLQSWVLVQVHRQESRLKVLNVTFVTNFFVFSLFYVP